MAKLSLTDVSGGYQLVTTYNANNTLLETALENTLSRDGTTPNTMSVALDMNSQLVTNIAVPVSNQDAASKKYVDDIVTGFTASATFSAALPYDITGSWDFEALASFEAGFRVYDAVDGADYTEVTNDGTDTAITSSGVGDINVTGQTGWFNVEGDLRVTGSTPLIQVTDAAEADWIYMQHTGSAGRIGTGGAGTMPIEFFPATTSSWILNAGKAFFQRESSAAQADQAAYGQIWVKDDTPNILMFTDDAGTDVQISATAATIVHVVKSADESITSDNTLTNDADLTFPTLTAGKTYSVKGLLWVDALTATPDIQMTMAATQTPQITRVAYHYISSTATNTADHAAGSATQAMALDGFPSLGTIGIDMIFQANASTAGTLTLKWAQNTSSADYLILRKGSYLTLTQLD
jgi:hypothetical protein